MDIVRHDVIFGRIERVDTIPVPGEMLDEVEEARCAARQPLSTD